MTAEEMSREEIDRVLCERDSGVLALTDGAETYAIPESFGYDGDLLYFQLVYGEDSHKMAFLESTDVATFTVFSQQPANSVIARGNIERVPDSEEVVATSAIAENATIPTLNVDPERPPAELDFGYYRLDPMDLSGRTFSRTVTHPSEI